MRVSAGTPSLDNASRGNIFQNLRFSAKLHFFGYNTLLVNHFLKTGRYLETHNAQLIQDG